MQLETSDVGFLMQKNWLVARIIAWLMGSKWSHSFIIIESGVLATYICETTEYEVVISPLKKYIDDENVNLEVFRPKKGRHEQKIKSAMECMNQIGTSYGWFQLVSLGLRRILMRLGIRIPNFIRQGVVCNGVVLYGLRNIPIRGVEGIDPESIDTEELYQIVSNSPDFERVFVK
jgi:hypothetical protein